MFDHPDSPTLLPNVNRSGVLQKDHGNESPYQVQPQVIDKRRYISQRGRSRPQAGCDVSLVTIQVKLAFQFQRYRHIKATRQAAQCINKARDRVQVRCIKGQGPAAALGQHLLNTLSQLFLSPAGLGHLLPEIPGLKYDPIEQEH